MVTLPKTEKHPIWKRKTENGYLSETEKRPEEEQEEEEQEQEEQEQEEQEQAEQEEQEEQVNYVNLLFIMTHPIWVQLTLLRPYIAYIAKNFGHFMYFSANISVWPIFLPNIVILPKKSTIFPILHN